MPSPSKASPFGAPRGAEGPGLPCDPGLRLTDKHLGRRDPAAADVLDAERPVDPASVDPAHAADAGDAGHVLFEGHALHDEGMDGPAHLFGVATQKPRPLRPGEDAAVETGQGTNPPGVLSSRRARAPARVPEDG